MQGESKKRKTIKKPEELKVVPEKPDHQNIPDGNTAKDPVFFLGRCAESDFPSRTGHRFLWNRRQKPCSIIDSIRDCGDLALDTIHWRFLCRSSMDFRRLEDPGHCIHHGVGCGGEKLFRKVRLQKIHSYSDAGHKNYSCLC